LVGFLYKGGLNNLFEQSTPANDDFFDAPQDNSGPALLEVNDEFLPKEGKGILVKHKYYALSYVEKHEQPEWVAYELTKASIQAPNVKRSGDFRTDQSIRSKSATKYDYKRSGYDRGHLVPAGDMAFSRQAMSETFFMSNMSPQVRNFNGGAWRELEETVRDWAYKNKHLYVVTGPIFKNNIGTIGENKVTIPGYYFKILLDNREPDRKAIAFIMPNESTDERLGEFAVTIDEVERQTGLNFFDELLVDKEEERLEGVIDIRKWKFDEKKYKSRKEHWNKR